MAKAGTAAIEARCARIAEEMGFELVDLGIASVSDIVRHLNNCIRLHSTNKDRFAREKWNEDIEFISDYKADPERFLIAQGIQSR